MKLSDYYKELSFLAFKGALAKTYVCPNLDFWGMKAEVKLLSWTGSAAIVRTGLAATR